MKIDLPTENWNDIFGFLPRRQLAELVPQIGDWHFAGKALFYLHDCGKITFDDFFIKPSANGNGTVIVEINKQAGREMPLADVPMPSNIKNFKRITLSSLDESVITFLKEFQSNSLLTNVNLTFYEGDDSAIVSTILTKILPLFDGITSINIRHAEVLTLLGDEYSQIAKPMLKSARFLVVWNYVGHLWYLEWLYSRSTDRKKPRVLTLFPEPKTKDINVSIYQLVERIRKDFLRSTRFLCFFIRIFLIRENYGNLQTHVLENSKTKVKLVTGSDSDELGNYVTISCCPLWATERWIDRMSQGTKSEPEEYKNIEIEI